MSTTTNKKTKTSRKMGKGNGTLHSVKGTYERPIAPLLRWVKTNSEGKEFIVVSLPRLHVEVFRPSKISEVSGYLMFERWTQGRATSLNALGKLELINRTAGTYRFYPASFKSKPIPVPVAPSKKDDEHPVGSVTAALQSIAADMSDLRAGMSAIFEATAQLLEKANKVATKN